MKGPLPSHKGAGLPQGQWFWFTFESDVSSNRYVFSLFQVMVSRREIVNHLKLIYEKGDLLSIKPRAPLSAGSLREDGTIYLLEPDEVAQIMAVVALDPQACLPLLPRVED